MNYTSINFPDIPQEMVPGQNVENVETQCSHGDRMCEDGSCISGVELCPEEQLMNQNTILIMIVVGLAVVIFLIILYCFQQRQRSSTSRDHDNGEDEFGEDAIHASLCLPPPTYEEVISTNLYPPTPQMSSRQTRNRVTSFDEPTPITPPPTYDTALVILARSHESILPSKGRTEHRTQQGITLKSPRPSPHRRSLSMNVLNVDDSGTLSTNSPGSRGSDGKEPSSVTPTGPKNDSTLVKIT